MHQLTVAKATLDDAVNIAPNLRSADKAELKAVTGLDPALSLVYGIGIGRSWTLFDEGLRSAPIAMFGVCPFTKRVGIPWMCATDDLVTHKRFFISHSKQYIDQMLSLYPDGLTNYIDARNKVHIEWLKHFGFEITGFVDKYGHSQLPFYRFSKNLKGLPSCAPQPQS